MLFNNVPYHLLFNSFLTVFYRFFQHVFFIFRLQRRQRLGLVENQPPIGFSEKLCDISESRTGADASSAGLGMLFSTLGLAYSTLRFMLFFRYDLLVYLFKITFI